MKYRVEWRQSAREDLAVLPGKASHQIVKKIENYLAQDPKNLGKPLNGELSGLYRYRMGDYRIIYHIMQQIVCISVVRVGHRKDVYDI